MSLTQKEITEVWDKAKSDKYSGNSAQHQPVISSDDETEQCISIPNSGGTSREIYSRKNENEEWTAVPFVGQRSILSQVLQGGSMNYLVTYECRTGTEVFVGEFEFESTEEPKISDQSIIDKARQDSVKFHTSGAAGLSIKSISLCLER